MPHENFRTFIVIVKREKSVLALGNNLAFLRSFFLLSVETVLDMHILSGQMTRCSADDAVWGKVRRT